MSLVSVTIALPDNQTAIVTGEPVGQHFAITPGIAIRPDGTLGLADHSRILTHRPTGRKVTSDSLIDMHAYALALEELPIDWATFTVPTAEQLEQIRATYKAVYFDPSEDLPWPAWAGDPSTPVQALVGGHLDDEFRGRRTDARKKLIEAVEAHDATLARDLGDQLAVHEAMDTVRRFGVVYLLTALHRVDAAAGDRAAHFLARALDGCDSLDEWMWQWRTELDQGLPLQLPGGGFPDLPSAA